MKHRRLVGAICAGCVVFAAPSVASAATVTVQVPPPATPAARALPPAVIAYPLSPGRALVTAAAPRGRARITLAPGAWIIATTYLRRSGPVQVRTRLVQVPRRGAVPPIRELQAGGEGGVAIGRITSTGFNDGELAPIGSTLDAALIGEAARLAGESPCKPPIVPPAKGDASRVWQAIERAARQAARSGPRAVRGQARAAASRLSGGKPSATFGGSIQDIGGGKFRGTFQLKDDTGRVISEHTVEGTSVRDVLRKAFEQALKSKCAPSRIQVDARFSVDASSREANAKTTITLRAVGRERIGSDGRPERGNFEYESPAAWVLSDNWQTTKLSTSLQPECALVPLPPNGFDTPVGPPTALGTMRPPSTAIELVFSLTVTSPFLLGSPCGADSRDGVIAVANVELLVGGVGKTGRASGETVALGSLRGTWTAEATVTALAPAVSE